MVIQAISDLHGFLPDYSEKINCDIVCICGDIVPLDIQRNSRKSEQWLKQEFIPWCESLNTKHVVFIAGNHDFIFEQSPARIANIFKNDGKIIYLNNNSCEIEGITIYGTPFSQYFGNWAFMTNDEGLRNVYSKIPEEVDILLSHGAPTLNEAGIIHQGYQKGKDAGIQELTNAVNARAIKYILCGHIHSGNHHLQDINGIKVANVSILDENYMPAYEPLTFELC